MRVPKYSKPISSFPHYCSERSFITKVYVAFIVQKKTRVHWFYVDFCFKCQFSIPGNSCLVCGHIHGELNVRVSGVEIFQEIVGQVFANDGCLRIIDVSFIKG